MIFETTKLIGLSTQDDFKEASNFFKDLWVDMIKFLANTPFPTSNISSNISNINKKVYTISNTNNDNISNVSVSMRKAIIDFTIEIDRNKDISYNETMSYSCFRHLCTHILRYIKEFSNNRGNNIDLIRGPIVLFKNTNNEVLIIINLPQTKKQLIENDGNSARISMELVLNTKNLIQTNM